jgi:uncharacterized SAM-binding protein YcdF (DUF218 family)
LSAYLIVFGAAVRADGSPSGSLLRRVQGALEFARTVVNPKFIATGGVGHYGPAEAVVIRELLMRGGIRQEDILLEDRARDTLDSIEFCHAILAGRGDVDVVVPCTSPYHIPRCVVLFRIMGYETRVPPMPSDRPHLALLKWMIYALKECIVLPYDALLLLFRHRIRGMR